MKFTKFDEFLGDALRDKRLLKRLKQEDMAVLISKKRKENGYKKGISKSAYSYYESGERSMPEDIYSYACDILDIDENALFNQALDYVKRKNK